jgi:hypothetical protein
MAAFAFRSLNSAGPYLVVVPMLAMLGGFYGHFFAPGGFVGPLAGVAIGLVWALLIGIIANRLIRRATLEPFLADVPIAIGIVAVGLMTGAGFMYGWMMTAALDEPSTTYAVLSALMRPAVPFYIALNSTMELVIIAPLVFWNWRTDPRRRALILVGVTVYFIMRVWYLVFAEPRFDMASHVLSTEEVKWFETTLAADFRIILDAITFVCLVLAALASIVQRRDREACLDLANKHQDEDARISYFSACKLRPMS